MKLPNGQFYVEVEDKRYFLHPTENTILRKRDPPISLGTQYQVQNETHLRKNRKVNKNHNNELEAKNYPKNKEPIQQQPNCPSCNRKNWLEFDKGCFCKNCEYFVNKQKYQIDKKFRGQDHYLSTRLPYANKKT